MIILTAKLPRHRKLTIGVAVAALACCAALVLTLGGGPAREASASAVPSPKGVKSNEDRVAYLQSYGWEVSAEPLATEELLIPKEMDASYDDYLALQSGQGFDLRGLYRPSNSSCRHPGQSADLQKHSDRGRGPLSPAGRLSPRAGHALKAPWTGRPAGLRAHFSSRWTFR